MSILGNWCKGEGLDPEHVIEVTDIPDNVEVEDIEKTLETIKALGRVKVRMKLFDPVKGRFVAYCVCKEKVNPRSIPLDVVPMEGAEPWPIHGIENNPVPPTSPTESLIRAMGEFFQKSMRPPQDGNAFKRLRAYSGIVPTPAGEESFDTWLEHALLMVEECDCSTKEKRKRIIESLKGPAFEIAQAVRSNDPDASPHDYLDAVEKAFGCPETGEELYFAFRALRQNTGERLSEFLRRIERHLNKVVRRGGILARQRDRVRVEQLLRGAVHSDLMLLQLQLREKKENPPSFLQLLNEIREEEQQQSVRQKSTATKTTVRQVRTADDELAITEMDSLKSELKELRACVSVLAAQQKKTSSQSEAPALSQAQSTGTQSDMSDLQMQVSELKNQLQVMTVNQRATRPLGERDRRNRDEGMNMASRNQVSRMRTESGQVDNEDFFCYRCGEDGHVATRCSAPENSEKVKTKLIRSLKKLQSGNRDSKRGEVNCIVKKSEAHSLQQSSLPEGLVGRPSFSKIIIEGQPCSALMDSGSTVTLVFESWYSKHLSHLPIHPISSLSLWGLSQSSYPYKGYIAMGVSFPDEGEEAGSKIVLALVCPDPCGPDQTPVIIGTNAKGFYWGPTADHNPEHDNDSGAHTLRVQVESPESVGRFIRPGWAEDEVGLVKWIGPGPLTIPPGGARQAICRATVKKSYSPGVLVVDAPARLPAGVVLSPCVLLPVDLTSGDIPVLLRNESLKVKAIPKGAVVAQIYKADIVTEIQRNRQPSSPIDPNLFDFGDSPISEAWRNRLAKKLSQRTGVFSLDEWDVGLAKGVEHHIRMNDTRPFRERSRRLPPGDLDDLRRHLQDLLAAGIIKESRSPYASPIVVARKKNGKIRMCIDYRTLNARTIPDQYTVPRIDDALDSLSGSRWFTVIDLRSGYYQIKMAGVDQEKTAFICPLGFFQFERMPQGITGAPATFQRLMEKAVGDMNLLQCLVYLDDIIIFSRTLEEHEERLFKVLDRLEDYGLKISLDKCQFCQPQVKYVGHIVSEAGIATDPEKLRAVAEWKQPTDLKSLQSFLGFCGYYRRFIENYSAIVRPLTDLTRGYLPAQKGKSPSKGKTNYFRKSEPFSERWTKECSAAFKQIIQRLTHAPVLAFGDPSKPYILHVDASFEGLGAVLNQQYPEGLRPVAFASRKLSNAERNYPVHQLEFLALKWAIVDKFHDYLYGARFTVRTDNNPLTYVLTSAKLNATGHRWLAALSTYEFGIQYRPGRENIDADSLSRNVSEGEGWIPPAGVKAVCKKSSVSEYPDRTISYAEQLGVPPQAIPEIYAYPLRLESHALERLSDEDLSHAQDSDAAIGVIKHAMRTGRWPTVTRQSESPEIVQLQREGNKLVLMNQLLYRKTKTAAGKEGFQLVLPKQFRPMVIEALHDDCGHLGTERTLALARDRFYWPKMAADISQYVQTCGRCVTHKTIPRKTAPLNQLTSRGPLDLVCIDFLSIEPDSRGVANVLVVTDHYTRYAQAYTTKDQRAPTVAKVLVERFFVNYGLPSRIHSDQGRDFESRLMKELLNMLGIRKSRTTPYHPQGDPQPERFNRTLLSMLGTLDPAQKQRWSQHVSLMVHAYNCTRHDATGYSPYYLMFGREARLPVDLCFGISRDHQGDCTHHQYVENLRRELRRSYQLAVEAANKNHQKNKRAYDSRIRIQHLEVGDRVLIRDLGGTGKQKLKDKWNSLPYTVVEQLPHLPVYRVRPENGVGGVKTLHRNHLLPVGQLIRLPEVVEEVHSPRRPRTRMERARKRESGGEKIDMMDVDQETSESEDEGPLHFPAPAPNISSQRTRNDNHVASKRELRSAESTADTLSGNEEEMPELEGSTESVQEPIATMDHQMDPTLFPAEHLEGDTIDSEIHPAAGPNNSDDAQSDGLVSKRQVKPVIRLSYDLPGQPTDKPVVVVHRGLRIHITQEYGGADLQSFTIHLNPVAPGSGCIDLKLKQ
ncbi:uncharacterized protein LOC121720890 [Alosa sapidissima]|uniref:uncharacterized protein LOC121720890 n=1 Tax=Alosa sapidissima TaxID=34773 RepID=UPI001C0A341C|nr:uncharacterized protein LOC121720890 [Alosa sapidissima]